MKAEPLVALLYRTRKLLWMQGLYRTSTFLPASAVFLSANFAGLTFFSNTFRSAAVVAPGVSAGYVSFIPHVFCIRGLRQMSLA